MNQKNARIYFVLALTIAVIIFVLFLFSDNDGLKEKISVIQGENKVLKIENSRIKIHNNQLKDSILLGENTLMGILLIEANLVEQLGKTQKELEKLKKQYEKARSHSNNYNADSVRLYFSEFQ